MTNRNRPFWREITLAEARSHCRHLAVSQGGDLALASTLVPRRLLRHVHHLAAYDRQLDLLSSPPGGKAIVQLRGWREELSRCYQGRPRHPVLIALEETIREFSIPPAPFLELLYAREQDQLVKRYRSGEQLLQYCRRAAQPLGHLGLYLFRCFDHERAQPMSDICTGLHLTHLWQNLGRDWERGRVYLPDEHRRRFGYADADLEGRQHVATFFALMEFEVEQARDFLYRGWPVVDRLPADLRVLIGWLVRRGLRTLDSIARNRHNLWWRRAGLSALGEVTLLTRALFHRGYLAITRPRLSGAKVTPGMPM